MIFITGDCHGNFERFNPSIFPEQKEMTKEDYVIICGDFGGVWHKDEESPEETMVLDWLDSRPFTTLFVCGNHENFDRLYQYPVEDWHGGKVHKIRDSVLHLMRGQVFEIEEKKIFSFGGASSHDIQGGVLEPDDPEFEKKYATLSRGYLPFRINHGAGGSRNYHRRKRWRKADRIWRSMIIKLTLLLLTVVLQVPRLCLDMDFIPRII